MELKSNSNNNWWNVWFETTKGESIFVLEGVKRDFAEISNELGLITNTVKNILCAFFEQNCEVLNTQYQSDDIIPVTSNNSELSSGIQVSSKNTVIGSSDSQTQIRETEPELTPQNIIIESQSHHYSRYETFLHAFCEFPKTGKRTHLGFQEKQNNNYSEKNGLIWNTNASFDPARKPKYKTKPGEAKYEMHSDCSHHARTREKGMIQNNDNGNISTRNNMIAKENEMFLWII